MITFFRNIIILLLFTLFNAISLSAQTTMTKTTVIKNIDTVSVLITQSAKPYKPGYASTCHAIVVSKADTVLASEENNKSVNTFSEQKIALPLDSNSKPTEKRIITVQKAVNTRETPVVYETRTAIRLE